MDNVTSVGWPEPSDWAKRLHFRLESLGSDYMATPWTEADDPNSFTGRNLKQARAAEVIVAVTAALRELPILKNSPGAAVLHDVAGALHQVVMGGAPRLFRPVPNRKAGGSDDIDRNYIKVFVVLAVRVLAEGHSWKPTKARNLVAQKFAEAGATGRKGNRLGESTVQSWCVQVDPRSANSDYVRIHFEVDRRLSELRANPQWPGDIQDALKWIDDLAQNPLLKSKYG